MCLQSSSSKHVDLCVKSTRTLIYIPALQNSSNQGDRDTGRAKHIERRDGMRHRMTWMRCWWTVAVLPVRELVRGDRKEDFGMSQRSAAIILFLTAALAIYLSQ